MTHSRRRILALICNVAAIVGCGAWVGVLAHAATYHVRQGGGGDCTVPQECIGKLQPGDTLLIHAGRYPAINIGSMGGSSNAPITIKAAPGEHAILDAYLGMGVNEQGVIEGDKPSYIVIGDSDGQLELTNSDPWIDQMRQLNMDNQADVNTFQSQFVNDHRINYGGVILGSNENHDMTFQHLTIHHVPAMAFGGWGTINSKFLNNTIYDIGYPRSAYGFYVTGVGLVFRGNVIHDAAYGFHMYGSEVSNSVVEHNLIYNIALKPYWHMSSSQVKHGGDALHIFPGGKNNSIQYNTIHNSSVGLSVYGSANVRNNLLYQNQTDRDPQSTIGSPNFMGNPHFVSARNDFRLQSGSPAKAAASDGGEVGAYGSGYTCVGANCGGETVPKPRPTPTPPSAPETR